MRYGFLVAILAPCIFFQAMYRVPVTKCYWRHSA